MLRDFAFGSAVTAAICALLLRNHPSISAPPLQEHTEACAAEVGLGAARQLGREAAVGVTRPPRTLAALTRELLPRAVVGPSDGRRRRSNEYYDLAAACDGARGEGRKGWLALLAAYDLAPKDEFILNQLVDSYVRASYPQLAVEELTHGPAAGSSAAERLLRGLAAPPRAAAAAAAVPPAPRSALPSPEFLVPFAGVVGRWDLAAPPREGADDPARAGALLDGNRLLYEASLRAYRLVRETVPSNATDTSINHALFEWQMRFLRETGAYWGGFTSIPLWRELERVARRAADELLEAHGRTGGTAARRDLIMWTSVHTSRSVHEPHNTHDSLVGGVYYVSVPPGSGNLALYDPRGLRAGDDDTAKRPEPPFHRSVELPAKEGVLVLFPGWLVHQVLSAPSPAPMDELRDGYRVSISVNFKGEWQDTTGLSLVLPREMGLGGA